MTETIDDIVDKLEEQGTNNANSNGKKDKPKQADILIALARASGEKFFKNNDRSYADIRVDGHRETWPIRSTKFRQWLKRLYFDNHKTVPHSDGVKEAVDLLDGMAQFEGDEVAVHLRVGTDSGRIYIDIGDADWRAIEVSEYGWKVVEEPPVRFRRPAGFLPLPTPTRGGNVKDLIEFLNVRAERDFVLLVSWLLAAMRPTGPYPVLGVNGEQGSAKSTLVCSLRRLIDPNVAPLRALPREERDLFIAANNGWILAFDNVSTLPRWLSDALCRISSGGGFAVRAHYTNDEEALFDTCRPIVLNGIEDMISIGDLADRSVLVTLEPITSSQRRAEDEYWAKYEQAWPALLGALLDALTHGLKHYPDVHLKTLPRMADFAKWGTACETAIWAAGAFARAYRSNLDDAVEMLIDADDLATTVKAFMEKRVAWEGTASELKAQLEASRFGDDPKRPKDWPADPTRLSGALRRASTPLRKIGINVVRATSGSTKQRRQIHITRTGPPQEGGKTASAASAASPEGKYPSNGKGIYENTNSRGPASEDSNSVPKDNRQATSVLRNPLKSQGGDSGDAEDTKFPPFYAGCHEPVICDHCGRKNGRVEPWDLNGRRVWLHTACTEEWVMTTPIPAG